jgi:hypothetical protein
LTIFKNILVNHFSSSKGPNQSEKYPGVHDPFSFSAPPFTGPRWHAMVMYALIGRLTRPQHSRSALLRCAVSAYWFDNDFSRMLVRVPVHGMQAPFELKRTR